MYFLSEQANLSMNDCHNLFFIAFKRWIELIKQKVDTKIERCFENEKNDVITELTKFGSSSIEVSNCFNHMLQFWKLINWPDSFGSDILLNELIESLSRAVIRYANLVKESNQLILNPSPTSSPSLSSPEQQPVNTLSIGKPSETYQKIIITTNNIERVRESLKNFLAEIDVHNNNHQKATNTSSITPDKLKVIESNRAIFETCISETSDYLIQIIENSLEIIVNSKINNDMQAHMFYLFESPECAPVQESISRIVKYLDMNLVNYKELVYKANFERLLKLIWIKLLVEIDANLKKGDTVSFFFNITILKD